MKIRVTLMTENDKHNVLSKEQKEKVEIAAKAMWQILLKHLEDDGETITVENVEVVEE